MASPQEQSHVSTAEIASAVEASSVPEQVIDFNEIFGRYIKSAQKVWAHDRSKTSGASETFDCLRYVWFEKRGAEFGFKKPAPATPESWGAMERGNIIENAYVVPGLRAGLPESMTLLLAGTDQQTLVVGRNSATPDGLITGLKPGPLLIRGGEHEIYIPDIKSNCIVLEIKSIDPRAILREERAKHHAQTQIQIGLIRETTEWKPVFSIILYVDASFLDKFTPFVAEYDEKIYAEAKQRANGIWEITDPMMVVPEGRFSGRCDTCPWKGPCTKTTIEAIPTNEFNDNPAVVEEMDPLIENYFKLKKESEDTAAAYEEAKENVKACLRDHDVKRLEGDTWKVSYGPVKGKETYDIAAMRAAGIDVEKYVKTGEGHDRIYVTDKTKPRKKKGSASK